VFGKWSTLWLILRISQGSFGIFEWALFRVQQKREYGNTKKDEGLVRLLHFADYMTCWQRRGREGERQGEGGRESGGGRENARETEAGRERGQLPSLSQGCGGGWVSRWVGGWMGGWEDDLVCACCVCVCVCLSICPSVRLCVRACEGGR